MHMLRSDAPHFDQFGEIYFSTVLPGAIKAWKRHKKMTLNIAVPVGTVHLVAFDGRTKNKSYKKITEFILGPNDLYALLKIPPLVWFGFQNTGSSAALLANCATIPHEPDETEQLDLNEAPIEFNWPINS